MLNLKRGSLTYLPFPNQEDKGISVKLCIVIDVEANNMVCLVPCTSSTHQDWRYLKSFEIKKDSPEGKQMKLKADSMVIVDRLDSFPSSLIKNTCEGTTPESILKKIENMLDE